MVIVQHANVPGFHGGFLGVDLFFVLSGYLITSLLLREAESTGAIQIGRFLLRRALRLMPPLLLVVMTVLVIGPYFWPDENLGFYAASAVLYLTDYVGAFYGSNLNALGHTWSLAVEEHFYLVWPFAVIGLAQLEPKPRIIVLVVAFCTATLWRIANAHYFPAWEMTGDRFDTRLSGLIMGALVCVVSPKLDQRGATVICIVSLCCLAYLTSISNPTAPLLSAYLQPGVDLTAASLIASVMSAKYDGVPFRLFAWRPAAYFGLISYSIYLWHWPIAFAIRTAYVDDWRIILPITLVLSLGLAALSWTFIERPMRTWRHKLEPA